MSEKCPKCGAGLVFRTWNYEVCAPGQVGFACTTCGYELRLPELLAQQEAEIERLELAGIGLRAYLAAAYEGLDEHWQTLPENAMTVAACRSYAEGAGKG